MPLILINWTCTSCGRSGTAVAETSNMIDRRVALSHEAKQPHMKRQRCQAPVFEMRARYEPKE